MSRRPLSLVAGAVALALSVTLAPPAVADQPTAPATSARAGAPTATITPAQLTQALKTIVRAGGVGVVAAVSDERGTTQAAAGAAALGKNRRPATVHARFRAASVTKMFTAVLALQMVDQGRWTMRTTIGDVAPGLWPAKRNVTLAQLLSHRSGLPDYLSAALSKATSIASFKRIIASKPSEAALVEVARGLPVTGRPGKRFAYSNTNFLVVGMMLERANRTGLGTLMKRRILIPARMPSSSYASTPRIKSPSLHEYAFFPKHRRVDVGGFQPVLFSGAGALVTTTDDLDRFQQALSQGRLLSAGSLALMRSSVSNVKKAGYVYGYGSYRLQDVCKGSPGLYGHDGLSFATHTMSLSSADGRRRITVAMTGRSYTRKQTAYAQMIKVVFQLAGTTCATVGPPAAPTPG